MRYVFIWVFPDFLDTLYKVDGTIAGKKVGYQISVSFEKFDVCSSSFIVIFLTLFQLTV
jgi:hypothetical protein